MKCAWVIAAILSAGAIGANAQTLPLVNGGFETGDLSGWSHGDLPENRALTGVVSEFSHHGLFGNTTYLPVEGSHFSYSQLIMLGDPTNPPDPPENPHYYFNGLYQFIDLDGDQVLSGSAAMLSNSVTGYPVEAFVSLFIASDLQFTQNMYSLFHARLSDLPDFGATPWVTFSLRPPAGTYLLAGYVRDFTSDRQQSPDLLLDGFSVTSVPEPATWMVLISGFALAGLSLRLARRWRRREGSWRSRGETALDRC